MYAWRDARAAAADGAVLGEGEGEGWELLAGLLAPRLDDKGRPVRLSAEQALAHPFLASSGSGGKGGKKEKEGKEGEAEGGTQARRPVEAAEAAKPAVISWPWGR